jgi:exopolyphosphatase/guanosine-5'-triphosphate,3'-diphosphate pyrophosphatase
MMQLAAIDIGTNSIHMILVRVAADGAFEVIGREKDMVRLGVGGLEGRPLGEGAMAAALQTLARFKRLADSRQVDDIVAVATSAVREASNGGAFLEAVAAQTGIRARVITGAEEAALIHRAAVHGTDIGSGPAVVVDIGGGSTEVTLGTASELQEAHSFRLGVIRLGERFVKSDPLSGGDERRMVRHIRHELGDAGRRIAKARHTRVIATSGTALALGAMALQVPGDVTIHHRTVSARAVRKIRRDVSRMRLAERLDLAGLEARRADLIVPGAVLLDVILRQLGADQFTLCELSLREGVILEYIRRNLVRIGRIERYPDVRRRSVIELALRCNYAAEHAQQVARLALALFDQTREAHGLDDRAREWLDFAALLHDVGEHISYERHHRHSYYLVRNGDLRGFDPDEIEVLALVARYHRRGAPRRRHEALAALPRPLRRAVPWLAAMLRVAESLDRSRAQLVDRVTMRRSGRRWTLRATGRGDLELERWAAQRNLRPLEAALGATVTLAAGRAVR